MTPWPTALVAPMASSTPTASLWSASCYCLLLLSSAWAACAAAAAVARCELVGLPASLVIAWAACPELWSNLLILLVSYMPLARPRFRVFGAELLRYLGIHWRAEAWRALPATQTSLQTNSFPNTRPGWHSSGYPCCALLPAPSSPGASWHNAMSCAWPPRAASSPSKETPWPPPSSRTNVEGR